MVPLCHSPMARWRPFLCLVLPTKPIGFCLLKCEEGEGEKKNPHALLSCCGDFFGGGCTKNIGLMVDVYQNDGTFCQDFSGKK